jgi:TolA-binding protein
MKKTNFLLNTFLLSSLFFFYTNDSFAGNKSSDKYLQSKIEILEQRIKLLERERDLINAKLEEFSKNIKLTQQNYQQNSDDINFHGIRDSQDIQFHSDDVKVELNNISVNNVDSLNEINNSRIENAYLEKNEMNEEVKTELIMNHNELADLYNNAVEQIRLKNIENSKLMLKKIISVKMDENSDSDSKEIIANAHYLIGELSLKAKNYEQASSHFLSAYNIFSKNNSKNIQGANSLYQLARSLHMMDKREGACNSLKKIVTEFKKLPENLKNKIDIEVTNLHCQ